MSIYTRPARPNSPSAKDPILLSVSDFI
jgi:hypothetical protein